MKRKIRPTTRVITFLVVFALSTMLAAQAHGQCSGAIAAGQWGFSATGVLLPSPTSPIPIAAAGRVTLSADGHVFGTEARNVGGGFADETIKGTWTVNSDCTGTITVNVYQLGQLVRTSVLDIIFVNNSTKLRSVQQSLVLPGPPPTNLPAVITFEGDKLFAESGD